MKLFLLTCLVVIFSRDAEGSLMTLKEYVQKPDPVYNYSYSNVTRKTKHWTAYMYIMTSQSWMTEAESSQPIWSHQMAIIIPHNVNKSLDTAMLYITGEDNTNMNSFPDEKDESLNLFGEISHNTQTPAGVIWQVPNQPIRFPCDPIHHPPENRTEDELVSLTFWHFVNVNASKPEFLSYYPMTKAAVRGLDTLAAVIPNHVDMKGPKHFIVGGASKRGWTTWLTGTVDDRVVGIVPIVLSALDLNKFMHRQFQFYGAWTFALDNYWHLNFTADIDSVNSHTMFTLIDPWYLRESLTMPKLAINAVGDEFQMPDDQRYWAHDMPGEMNLLMLKNADHTCSTALPEVVEGYSSFVSALQADYARPNYTWHIDEESGNITVYTPVTPKSVTVYYADSPMGISEGRRDFRWAALNVTPCESFFGGCFRKVTWNETSPVEVNPNTYTAHFEPPQDRWLGFLMEVHWENPTGPTDFVFTSPTSVIPNTLPFANCHGHDCEGVLC